MPSWKRSVSKYCLDPRKISSFTVQGGFKRHIAYLQSEASSNRTVEAKCPKIVDIFWKGVEFLKFNNTNALRTTKSTVPTCYMPSYLVLEKMVISSKYTKEYCQSIGDKTNFWSVGRSQAHSKVLMACTRIYIVRNEVYEILSRRAICISTLQYLQLAAKMVDVKVAPQQSIHLAIICMG